MFKTQAQPLAVKNHVLDGPQKHPLHAASLTFCRAYDALQESRPRGADLEYLRLLRLAATTMECQVEDALAPPLEAGLRPD